MFTVLLIHSPKIKALLSSILYHSRNVAMTVSRASKCIVHQDIGIMNPLFRRMFQKCGKVLRFLFHLSSHLFYQLICSFRNELYHQIRKVFLETYFGWSGIGYLLDLTNRQRLTFVRWLQLPITLLVLIWVLQPRALPLWR